MAPLANTAARPGMLKQVTCSEFITRRQTLRLHPFRTQVHNDGNYETCSRSTSYYFVVLVQLYVGVLLSCFVSVVLIPYFIVCAPNASSPNPGARDALCGQAPPIRQS